MARVRAYVDLAKHTMDLKSVNDAFVRTMDELKSSKNFPEEALKGLEIFYSKRANERDYIEETVIAGKQDGMTLQNVKAYREKLKLGKKKKEEKQSSTSYSESSDYDYSCSNDGDDDISDLYSSGDDEDEDEDDDDDEEEENGDDYSHSHTDKSDADDSHNGGRRGTDSFSTRSDESGSS